MERPISSGSSTASKPTIPRATTTPRPSINSTSVRERWMYTTYIELVVDGEVVDLNRVPLPPDTPIIDERFKSERKD